MLQIRLAESLCAQGPILLWFPVGFTADSGWAGFTHASTGNRVVGIAFLCFKDPACGTATRKEVGQVMEILADPPGVALVHGQDEEKIMLAILTRVLVTVSDMLVV